MDEVGMSKARYMVRQMDVAFKDCPTGTIWERLIPGLCKHPQVRCTHGDEIIGRNGKRRVCMVCGRGLKGPIPEICFFTNTPHRKH